MRTSYEEVGGGGAEEVREAGVGVRGEGRAGAGFEDAALCEEEDFVGALDGGEAVGDDDGGSVGEETIDTALDAALGGGIEPGAGLVQDDEARVLQEDAHEGEELGFTR